MWKSSEAGSFNEGAGWLLQETAIAHCNDDSIPLWRPLTTHNPTKLDRRAALANWDAA
jgi:hypothetical protein